MPGVSVSSPLRLRFLGFLGDEFACCRFLVVAHGFATQGCEFVH